jgi:hypothetical protein
VHGIDRRDLVLVIERVLGSTVTSVPSFGNQRTPRSTSWRGSK